jgi:hypothetical protein
MDLLASAAATILGPESEISEGTREIPPFLSRKRRRPTFDEVTEDFRDFHDLSDRRVAKVLKLLSDNSRRFCIREFFTATIDVPYYNAKDDFMDCLGAVGLAHVSRLSRKEWSTVRSIICSKLGHPRRFSQAFLRSERQKLYESRKVYRRNQENPPVSVGDVVTVRDPSTSLLFKGLVISTADNGPDFIGIAGPSSQPSSFIVQLDRPELGIEVYDDVDIYVHQHDSQRPTAAVDGYRIAPSGLRRSNSQHSLSSTTLSLSLSQSQQGPSTQPSQEEREDESVSAAGSISENEENIFLSSQNSSHMTDDEDRSYQPVFEEPKEVILKRCADSVKKVWPGKLLQLYDAESRCKIGSVVEI